MQTFSIQTLGCRVNHYESEQIAAALRARGLTQVDAPAGDVLVVHTCSVTTEAAKSSRKAVRRATSLPVLQQTNRPAEIERGEGKVIVTGCWATSDTAAAEKMPGVDAVLTHHEDVAGRLGKLLDAWTAVPTPAQASVPSSKRGLTTLPLLGDRQTGHQRAFLKIQDGCDAHCTYCIIPSLRPTLWSKPITDAVIEARQLVAAGHKEIVLTGIFLGAFGQPTALRRRQPDDAANPLADLIDALCTQVDGLARLRLSSMEPGDLTPELIERIKVHPQVVPHFHLPLQAGSDRILRKMNRQYGQGDFLDMVARVNDAFDRPAITTDIIAGFPGESDADFDETLKVVDATRFIHTHAFTYSPRPGTAAARWEKDRVRGDVANQRIKILQDRARQHSEAFRKQFVGETVTVLVERNHGDDVIRHGRCERYFDVHFEAAQAKPGDFLTVRVDRVQGERTHGTVVARAGATHASSVSVEQTTDDACVAPTRAILA